MGNTCWMMSICGSNATPILIISFIISLFHLFLSPSSVHLATLVSSPPSLPMLLMGRTINVDNLHVAYHRSDWTMTIKYYRINYLLIRLDKYPKFSMFCKYYLIFNNLNIKDYMNINFLHTNFSYTYIVINS